jgi:penicillin-binding protein 1A
VRLIDMTRAVASVANKGVAVTPYAIRKVVTADGRQLYQHDSNEERVLVAPWVAAEMTDLLQSAVLTGTGRAAQIGRPVAGKTGTTQSNKDGWFIGFSSGLTTGVWMGRDDARAVGGLQGGTAPARAFHDFMATAVANRPAEQFETQVPLPDWELTPEEEMFGDMAVDQNAMFPPLVDENGMPIGQPGPFPGVPQQQPMIRPDGTGDPSQQELDQAFPPQQAPQPDPLAPQPRVVQPPPRQPRSPPPADPSQPRPYSP